MNNKDLAEIAARVSDGQVIDSPEVQELKAENELLRRIIRMMWPVWTAGMAFAEHGAARDLKSLNTAHTNTQLDPQIPELINKLCEVMK